MGGEPEIFNFENLNVYKKALEFINLVYCVTNGFPSEERFALTDQFRRAAYSIALNIAEGYGTSNLEFKRYLRISKGSIRECIAIISIGKMREYIDYKTESKFRCFCVELSKMLSGLINSLKYYGEGDLD